MVLAERKQTQPEQQEKTAILAESIGSYVQSINGKVRLTSDEEKTFCRLRDEIVALTLNIPTPIADDKNPEAERLMNLRNSLEVGFLTPYIGVVNFFAQHYPQNQEDLIAEGRKALLDASRRFDASKTRFLTFAPPRVRGAIIDSIRSGVYDNIPIPRSFFAKIKRINDAQDALFEKLKREPTEKEIANQVGISIPRLRNIRLYQNQSQMPISLDQFSTKDEDDKPISLAEQIKTDNSSEMETERIAALQRSFWIMIDDLTVEGKLSEMQKTILEMYGGRLDPFQNLTYKDIAQAINKSKSRVEQLTYEAFDIIREAAKERKLDRFL